MPPATPPAKPSDVPAMVFEQFIAELAAADVPADLVERLRKTLIDDQDLAEAALRTAIFGEEPPQ